MIKKTTRTQEITESHYYCDICDSLAKTRCCKCHKDLCNKCVEHEDSDRFSDYRGDCYCAKCWDLGERYRVEIEAHEKEIKRLSDEWDKECNKQTQNG
jgi:hypothetical protein